MFTPQTPDARNTLLALILLLGALNTGKTQNLTLHPLLEYEASLKTFHTQRRDAARTEYQHTNRKKWWYYVPNVGLGLTYPIAESTDNGTRSLTTRTRLAPSINLGTGVLTQIDQNRNQQKAKLAAIDAEAQFQYRSDLVELHSRYQAIQLEQENVAAQESVAKLETSLFNITKEANDKKEIKPADYQQARLLYEQRQLTRGNERHQLQLKILALETFARYHFPDDEL